MVADGIIAYIGIGSNLENPLAQCRKAINVLACADGIKVLQVSSFYNTEPVGMTAQNDFVNAVCEIRTRLSPRPLIGAMKTIEECMGRHSSTHWGPRIIDLDLLFYDQEVIQDEDLKIPHPECH
jgi:2-amino-4-hydroxy-6-hydroxymethyldihydropteridine diphosphokinase